MYFMVLRGIVAYLKFYPMGFQPRKLGAWRCLNISPTNEIVFEPDNQQVGRVKNLPPFLNHLLQNLNPLKVKSKKKKAKKFSQFLNSSSFSLLNSCPSSLLDNFSK